MEEKMTTRDYDRYKSAITTANELKDKDSLKKNTNATYCEIWFR